MFCSEGLFNGAASIELQKNFEVFATTLHTWLSTSYPCFVNLGEIGELVERMMMVKAVISAQRTGFSDYVAKVGGNTGKVVGSKTYSEQICEPVSLEDFLDSFVGYVDREKYLDRFKELRGSFLGFNHFASLRSSAVADDVYGAMANFLCRGAGLIPKPGTKGFDAMIPLVLATNEISFVYIQTKFGRSYSSFPTAEKVYNSSPHAVFGDKIGNGEGARPYCYIFHHIASSCEYAVDVYPRPEDAQKAADVKKKEDNITDSSQPHNQKKRKAEPEKDGFYYPCLVIQGIQKLTSVALFDLVSYLNDKPDDMWMIRHQYLKNVWSLPVGDRKIAETQEESRTWLERPH
jgi:hypothetical protein